MCIGIVIVIVIVGICFGFVVMLVVIYFGFVFFYMVCVFDNVNINMWELVGNVWFKVGEISV